MHFVEDTSTTRNAKVYNYLASYLLYLSSSTSRCFLSAIKQKSSKFVFFLSKHVFSCRLAIFQLLFILIPVFLQQKMLIYCVASCFGHTFSLWFFSNFLCLQKDELNDKDQKHPKEMKKVLTSSLPQTMQGHTGFLTFASLPPAFAR